MALEYHGGATGPSVELFFYFIYFILLNSWMGTWKQYIIDLMLTQQDLEGREHLH